MCSSDLTFLRFCFCGNVTGEEAGRKLDREIVALHWLSFEELKKRKAAHRSPLVLQCVEDFLGGKRYPLDLLSRDFP